MILGGTSYSESPFSGAEFQPINRFVYPSSLEAISFLGLETPTVINQLSGFLATAELGDVQTQPIFVAGFEIASSLSNDSKVQLASYLLGLEATTTLGIARLTRSVSPSGVSATSAIGSETSKISPIFVGLQGQGQTGTILFVTGWNTIPTYEPNTWNVFSTDNDGNWTIIGNFKADTWNDIDT